MARSRAARDGVVQFAALAADQMQMVRLRRLRGRLRADPALDVFGSGQDYGDGMSYLTVYPAGTDKRRVAVWGYPRGAEPDDPGGVTVEFLDGDPRD